MGPRFGGAENDGRLTGISAQEIASMGPRFGGAENASDSPSPFPARRFNGAALWGRGKHKPSGDIHRNDSASMGPRFGGAENPP